jgi:hypothetical protein
LILNILHGICCVLSNTDVKLNFIPSFYHLILYTSKSWQTMWTNLLWDRSNLQTNYFRMITLYSCNNFNDGPFWPKHVVAQWKKCEKIKFVWHCDMDFWFKFCPILNGRCCFNFRQLLFAWLLIVEHPNCFYTI